MKKRILSLLLVLCMVVGMLPASVFAADATESTEITATADALIRMRADATAITAVEGKVGQWNTSGYYYVSVTLQPGDGPYYFKTNDAGYVIDGTEDDHTIEINYLGNAAKLILKGATITNDHANYPALILGENSKNDVGAETAEGNQADYEIIVEGDSSINQTNGTSGRAILNSTVGTLTVTSVNDAKLAVKGKTTGTRGVFHNVGSLVLKNANLYVGGYSATVHYAIYSLKNIDIIGGNVQAHVKGSYSAIYAAGNITVDAAKLTAYSSAGITVKADGANGVTFKDSLVKLGSYSAATIFAAAPTIAGYADGYTVKTDTNGSSNSSHTTCPTDDNVNFDFQSSAVTSNTFDAASATTYKMFEIKPVKEDGLVKFAAGDTATNLISVPVTQGQDPVYYTKVDGTFVEGTKNNYQIKIAYPAAGDVEVYLKGAELINNITGSANSAALFLGTNNKTDPGAETAAGNKADYKIIVEEASAILQTNSTTGRAIFGSTVGDVTITSVNGAQLMAGGRMTGSHGQVSNQGNLILKNANLYIDNTYRNAAGDGTVTAGNSIVLHSYTGNVIFDGGIYNLYLRNGTGKGIYAYRDITIKGGAEMSYVRVGGPAFTADTGAITIDNSTVKVSGSPAFSKPPVLNYVCRTALAGTAGAKNIVANDTTVTFALDGDTVSYVAADASTYTYLEVTPAASHTLSGDYSTDETYHWGVCSVCGVEISKEAHTEGPALKENEVPATETEAGSYNLVTRCLTCNMVMSSVPVTVPAVRKARVVFFTGAGTNTDGVDRFILTVNNDGEALYYWTVNGALATTNADGLEANEDNGYNVKFVYNPNDTAAKLYLKDAEISNNSTSTLFYIAHPNMSGNVVNFSLEIVLEGANTLTKTTSSPLISVNTTEGNTLAITGTGSLSVYSKMNNSSGGIINSPVDLTIGKDATVNLYHTNTTYANDIVMNEGADLVINGKVNIYNATAKGYNADHPEYKNNPIITNGGGDVYINKGAAVTIVTQQNTHAFDVSGTLYVDAATLTVAMDGDGYLFKNSNVVLTGVDDYVSLESANIDDVSDPTKLLVSDIPATELYNAENVLLYKYAAIVPHNHTPAAAWSSDENSHWQACNGHCPDGVLHNQGAHVAGEAQMENIVEATSRAEGSYDMVKRCVTCGYVMETEHFTTPKINQAYVWFFYRDDANKVPVAVNQGGNVRYLKTTDLGKIEKDAEGKVVEASEADYNIKLEYPAGAEKATLTLRNAKLVTDGNDSAIQFGYGDNCTNFSIDIVLVGTTDITCNGATNYRSAIESGLDADQKVRIIGDGTLNVWASTNSGGNGVISAPNLTIGADATVNAYNITAGNANGISVTNGDLIVNGKLGVYSHNNGYRRNDSHASPIVVNNGNVYINEGAKLTIRTKQRSYAFDVSGNVYINNGTLDALVGAVSGVTSPDGTYVFMGKAPIYTAGMDVQGSDSLSIEIDSAYQIVGTPELERIALFDDNVLNYRYVVIAPHVHKYTDRVSSQLASAATCEHGDLYYVQCHNCDLVSNTVTVETTKPLAHNWADATCTSGKVCSDCKAVYTYGSNPYYMVNLAEMENISNTYGMPSFWTDANNVVKYGGVSDVKDIALNLKKTFDAYPVGARYISFTLLSKSFKSTYQNGIYMENGVEITKAWLNEFLPAYKAIGGQLDGFIVDLEFEYGRGYDLRNIYDGDHAKVAKDTEIYKKIYNDPHFATVLKPLLDERKFPYASGDDPLSSIQTDSTAYEIYNWAFYIVMNKYIDQAMASVFEYYPDAYLSDYDRGYTEGWQASGFEGEVAQGITNRVGTSSNMSLYMMDPSYLIFRDGKKPNGYNKGTFADTAFNAAKYNVERFKQMLAATPVEEDGSKNVSVWIAEYNYYQTHNGVTRPAYTNQSPYYAEAILHLGLSNPSPFIGYVKPPVVGYDEAGDEIHDMETYAKYLAAVNSLMLELTEVAGTDDRRPIELPYSWNDDYILSGMYAGGRNIWRITPEDGLDGFLVMSENGTPTFRAGGQTIIFPQGRIVETENTIDYEYGTCGYWVETPADVMPVVVSNTDRYSEANGYTGTANKTDLRVYNKYGYLVDASVANEGFTAYRVDWMNVTNDYKYVIVKNNGTEIKRVLMAPGQDSFFVGEIADGTNLLTVETIAATGYEPADPYANTDFDWSDATMPTHTYKYVSIDENNHKYACDCGAVKIASEAHEFADDDDTTCDKCGYERNLGPQFDERLVFGTIGISLQSGIVGQFGMPNHLTNYGFDTIKITVQSGSDTYDITEYDVKGANLVFYIDFAAAEMTKAVTVTIYATDGDKEYYGETLKNWTIKQKALDMLATNYPGYSTSATKKKLCDLLVNMLNYGAKAQEKFKVNNSEGMLATDGLDDYEHLIRDAEDTTISGWTRPEEDSSMVFKGKTFALSLRAEVQLVMGFTVPTGTDLTQYELRITNNTRNTTYDPQQFTLRGSDAVVYFTELAAAELRDVITVTVYQGETAVSESFTFSVENLAAGMVASYPDLIPAMMNYSDCAKTYFNK